MEKQLFLYHGSEKIIKKPIYGYGKKNNDFGLGFYCTENENLAKEWAVSSLDDGFANKYSLNMDSNFLKDRLSTESGRDTCLSSTVSSNFKVPGSQTTPCS